MNNVYVLGSDNVPVMPCHPSRARELVRKGYAHWVRYNTIRLLKRNSADCSTQPIIVGMDMGAKKVGVAAATTKRLVWLEQAELRDYGTTMQTRARLRRTRRGRLRYRQPWYSPTRFVRLSACIYNKNGAFLRKATVAEARRLLKPDNAGRPQAKRLQGNSVQLLTRHKPPKQDQTFRPTKDHIRVVDQTNTLIGWLNRQSDDGILRHLTSNTRRHRSRIPKAIWLDSDTLQLTSSKNRRFLTEKVRPKGSIKPTVRKFGQQRQPEGWLPPTIQAKANAHVRLVHEMTKKLPISEVRVEVAQFDMQRLDNEDIQGEQYQQGTTYGYFNLREFVFARDGYKCIYCGKSGIGSRRVLLNVDHVIPQSQGGPTRADNLVTSCRDCNEIKSNRSVKDAFPEKAASVTRALKRNIAFREAAHVSMIKTAVLAGLRKLGFPIISTYGYRTKYDRIARHLPKNTNSHAIDAGVIATGPMPTIWPWQMLLSRFVAHGQYQQFDTQPMPKNKERKRDKPSKMIRGHQYAYANEINRVSTDGRVKKRMIVRGYMPKKKIWVTGYAVRLMSNGGIGIGLGYKGGNPGILGTIACSQVKILRAGPTTKLQREMPITTLDVPQITFG